MILSEDFLANESSLTFQIGLDDSARGIPGKFTFATDLECFQLNSADVMTRWIRKK